jgi:hypothetical protein
MSNQEYKAGDKREVAVRYWKQETQESGCWYITQKMPISVAKDIIASRLYERAEIVEDAND